MRGDVGEDFFHHPFGSSVCHILIFNGDKLKHISLAASRNCSIAVLEGKEQALLYACWLLSADVSFFKTPTSMFMTVFRTYGLSIDIYYRVACHA
jgi:hypothetical protein